MSRVIHSVWPWNPNTTANSVPNVPAGLNATAVSSTQINLTWNIDATPAPNGAGYYEIEISTDNLLFSQLTTVSNPGTGSFSATGLNPSTQYWFRMGSCNVIGCSSRSASATATTASATPTAAWSIDWSSGTPSGYTLTRASTGTYVDSSGYIASASTDIARLTHNSSGSRLGLLVEGQRTNVNQRSEEFNNGYYTLSDATVTANDTTAPDNTTTADLLKENTATSIHALYRVNIANSSGTNYTFSVFVKASGRTAIAIQFAYASFSRRATQLFDLSTGATSGAVRFNGVSVTTSASVENYGNGWYRCIFTVDVPSGDFTVFIDLSDSLTPTWSDINHPSYTGNGTDGVHLWGAQMEAGTSVSSYIPTTTASVTRSADLAHVLDSSITSWGDPGALVVHFYPPQQAGTIVSTDDASTAQVGIEASTTTDVRAFWSSGSTATGTIGSGVQKAVHYWNGSTSKFCINGGTVQSGTNNLTIANTDFVTFGAEATDSGGAPSVFSQYANCVIRKVEFYTGTLTDANLQTITT